MSTITRISLVLGIAVGLLFVNRNVAFAVAAPGFGADFNSDGLADAADYPIWRDYLGTTGSFLQGDADGDGQVTVADYEVWQDAFGDLAALQAPLVANGVGSSTGPIVSAIGVPNGGNIDWSVFIAPDPSLFGTTSQGLGGSVSTELSFEVATATLLPGSLVIDPAFMEVIGGVPILNPGNDPYSGMVEVGPQTYSDVLSFLGSGNVDAIFAPLGSTIFTSGGPKLALSFSTTAAGDTLTFGGLVTQAGQGFTAPTTSVAAIPEPASVTLAMLGLVVAASIARRRV